MKNETKNERITVRYIKHYIYKALKLKYKNQKEEKEKSTLEALKFFHAQASVSHKQTLCSFFRKC